METVGTIPVGDRKLGIAEVTHGGPVLLGPKNGNPEFIFMMFHVQWSKYLCLKVISHHVSCVSWS